MDSTPATIADYKAWKQTASPEEIQNVQDEIRRRLTSEIPTRNNVGALRVTPLFYPDGSESACTVTAWDDRHTVFLQFNRAQAKTLIDAIKKAGGIP